MIVNLSSELAVNPDHVAMADGAVHWVDYGWGETAWATKDRIVALLNVTQGVG